MKTSFDKFYAKLIIINAITNEDMIDLLITFVNINFA
tara:strand:- start:21990 stop:22100 length:111 start_codon:yes stop_codon:yes gene_type:complete